MDYTLTVQDLATETRLVDDRYFATLEEAVGAFFTVELAPRTFKMILGPDHKAYLTTTNYDYEA